MKYIDLHIYCLSCYNWDLYVCNLLSQYAELCRSIRRVARLQSKLFDSMVTAEIEKEIEKRVMQIIRTQSVEMEKETGVQPYLNDQEIKDYLKQVIREVKR